MSRLSQQVGDFHRVTGIAERKVPGLIEKEFALRACALIAEELFELAAACGANFTHLEEARHALSVALEERDAAKADLVEMVDAWGDIAYLVESAFRIFGVESEEVLDEIQRANMAKSVTCTAPGCWRGVVQKNDSDSMPCSVCNGTGRIVKRREDGKILKPEGWTPPTIAAVLVKQGWMG